MEVLLISIIETGLNKFCNDSILSKKRKAIFVFHLSNIMHLSIFITTNVVKVRFGLRKNSGFIAAFRNFAPHLTAD